MTIYVDELRSYPGKWGHWCHMMTGSDIEELHQMAERLGIRRYFQDHPLHPHYDLVGSKRSMAVAYGAVAIRSVEMIKLRGELFKEP